MSKLQQHTRQKAGAAAEDLALDLLQRRGFELVARNFRCRCGELDLVMRKESTLAVIEVRQRSSTRYGSAVESVNLAKQRRIERATLQFLVENPALAGYAIRFDIIAVGRLTGAPTIDWIRGAFESSQ